ncbi:MAG: hypothetical protein CL507_02385 [Actinobacteria bacterium]|nr:hypothetical protein [Actinomycetota bacterium]|tara:strand:- start:733 stop:1533 length:801 start_codon:yes stop_codon:yes gene_type:complete
MAENTFTVDTTPDTVTMTDNLTSDEQDSLAVGEKIVESQEQLLAGKYKDAAELEKAYVELQKKLGSNEPEEEVEQTSATGDETEETSLSDGASLISSANEEYYANDGKLSEETLDKFSNMSSKELVEAYLEVQNTDAFKNQAEVADLSEADINNVKNFAGGEAQYDNLITWADSNLDDKAKEAFDSIVNTGSIDAIKIAVSGLKSQYEAANGYEGKMYTGKAPKGNTDVFRSQAELVAAMNDKRYDRDPAYRQDIIEKLDRSNLDF